MARVVLFATLAHQFTNGLTELEIPADNYRELLTALETRFPGIAQTLRSRTAVAIDGEIFQEPYLESIGPHSEVFFLPQIEGGS